MNKKLLVFLLLVSLVYPSTGLAQSKEQQLNATRKVLLEQLEETPRNVELLCELAEVHFYLGDWLDQKQQLLAWEGGVGYAQRAVELNPQSPDAHYWIAALSGKIGNAQGILQSLLLVNTMFEHLEITLDLDPNYAWAYFVLSHLYWELPPKPLGKGDRQQALNCARRAWELDLIEPEFSVHYAKLLVKQRQSDQARQVLEQALAYPHTQWTIPLRSEAEELLASLVARR